MATEAQTPTTLADMTVPELKERAKALGVSSSDAKEFNGGKTPNKAAWIKAIRKAQKTGPKPPKTDEEGEEPQRVEWDVPETKNAAELVRAGLLAGVPDFQIVETVREVFPDYGAWKIACAVYRRELKKKGKLPE